MLLYVDIFRNFAVIMRKMVFVDYSVNIFGGASLSRFECSFRGATEWPARTGGDSEAENRPLELDPVSTGVKKNLTHEKIIFIGGGHGVRGRTSPYGRRSRTFRVRIERRQPEC